MQFLRGEERIEMLRITTEKKRGKTVLSVEGRLSGPRVPMLEQCWRELRAGAADEKFDVNLCGVTFIDGAGKVLLKAIHSEGAVLIAEGCLNQAIVREITTEAKTGTTEKRGKGPGFFFYVLFFGLLIGAKPGFAQTQPAASPDPSKLTLEQAVSLALKQNTTAQIAILQAAQANQDKNVARAALLPGANLQVSDSLHRQNLETGLGTTFPGFPHHIGPFQVFSAGVGFSVPVFDLTLWKRYQAAKELAGAQQATSYSTREQVILLVVSQYIGTLRAVANVTASKSRVELAQALYDQAADLQKEGVGTGIDTLRANVELQNEKQLLIQAENDRDASLFVLSRLLNLDPRQKIELADSLSFFDTPQPEMDSSIDAALSARQEWKSLDQQIKAARHDKQASQAERLPSFRVDGNWDYQGTHFNNGIPVYTYQAGFNMPLFTGGRIHAEIVKADLQIKVLEEQRADLRNSIALDVKTALLNLESARNEVQVANLGVQLAKEEVEQARDRFKAGVANNIEVIQAQDALARSNDNQIVALYRFNQARADYARGIGQMEKVYAK
ncbi:MAG: TolC family protein [Acidobacteria bacterium]|nr:TolC family protein [Acidobacteriota bacterium]MBS1867120.1 TolC family protein [Acidobacteriota bacterium]